MCFHYKDQSVNAAQRNTIVYSENHTAHTKYRILNAKLGVKYALY